MTATTRAPLPAAAPDPPVLRLIDAPPASSKELSPTHGTDPYREVLEALDVAVYTTDRDGRITFYNGAAATLWGREPDLGELWCGSWRLYRQDGRPMAHAECPMAVALNERRRVRGAIAIAERPDGSRVAFEPFPTPLFSPAGELVGAVNVLVDVTTRQMAQSELLTTAEALVASNAVRDEFLGLVSHELRTPVTTIFGNAVLLQSHGERVSLADRGSLVDGIVADAERLSLIIENLLVLTRLQAGTPLELGPEILTHIAAKAVDDFARRHAGCPVTIRSTARRHLIVDADRTYLELLLSNLLGNARKYGGPTSPIEVVVRATRGEARVVVLDHGIGLGGADPDRLFDPFYRAQAAERHASGVGLGLAVCKRIVEALGGRIWARPRRGGGTEVGFGLPLADHPVDI